MTLDILKFKFVKSKHIFTYFFNIDKYFGEDYLKHENIMRICRYHVNDTATPHNSSFFIINRIIFY